MPSSAVETVAITGIVATTKSSRLTAANISTIKARTSSSTLTARSTSTPTSTKRRKSHRQNVLVLGARGRTAVEIVRQLSEHPSKPSIHTVCQNTSKLADDPTVSRLCTSIMQGNARSPKDMEQAIRRSQATTIVIAFRDIHSVGRTNLRHTNANVLVDLLQRPEHQHIQVIIVSTIGAGPTTVYGGGFGRTIWKQHRMRFVMVDHTLQERAFLRTLRDRIVIVRPTELTDGKAKGKIQVFGDYDRTPSSKTDRQDLAHWIVNQICGEVKHEGK